MTPFGNPFVMSSDWRKLRIMRIREKAARKREIIERCSMQAKLHKAKLMLRDKGRNGRSMNDAMVRAHGIQRKGAVAV